jgi:hypothetical protein
MDLLQIAAGRRIGGAADILEDLVAARLGEGAGDQRDLPVGQVEGGGATHGVTL